MVLRPPKFTAMEDYITQKPQRLATEAELPAIAGHVNKWSESLSLYCSCRLRNIEEIRGIGRIGDTGDSWRDVSCAAAWSGFAQPRLGRWRPP